MTIATTPEQAVERESVEQVFVDRLRPLLPSAHRLAYGLMRDPHQAEDAVQEAILKAWRAFGGLRSDSNVRAWFLRIVANECRQERRRRWWTVLRPGELPDVPAADPGVSMEDADELRRSLTRLPRDQRLAIVLRSERARRTAYMRPTAR